MIAKLVLLFLLAAAVSNTSFPLVFFASILAIQFFDVSQAEMAHCRRNLLHLFSKKCQDCQTVKIKSPLSRRRETVRTQRITHINGAWICGDSHCLYYLTLNPTKMNGLH